MGILLEWGSNIEICTWRLMNSRWCFTQTSSPTTGAPFSAPIFTSLFYTQNSKLESLLKQRWSSFLLRVPQIMADEIMEIDGSPHAGSPDPGTQEERPSPPGQLFYPLSRQYDWVFWFVAQLSLPRTTSAKFKSRFTFVKPIKIHGYTLGEELLHKRFMDSHLVSVSFHSCSVRW